MRDPAMLVPSHIEGGRDSARLPLRRGQLYGGGGYPVLICSAVKRDGGNSALRLLVPDCPERFREREGTGRFYY